VIEGTREQRSDAGRARRSRVPRSSLAGWDGGLPGRDPVAVLEQQAATRVAELVPVRYGRMAESPFAFFRGGAAIMAMDLASAPTTGIRVQATGDAHVANFGKFASPERNLVFDLNDFDETLPGPWEWDVKRLCASLQVVGRQRGFSRGKCERVVVAAARAYREHLADYATWRVLDLWYERTEIKDVIDHFPMKYRERVDRDAAKARRKDHLRAVAKLTEVVEGHHRFVEDPPLLVHISNTDAELADIDAVMEGYRATLTDDRGHLVDRFRVVDVARKVVGVGSVGTRCWIALLEAPDHPEGDLIVLQVKEAQPSVLEPYVGGSELGHHGKRVVVGQRQIQAAGDILLGWSTAPTSGSQYYVRQLWDLKGQGDPMIMPVGDLTRYGELCAWILARSHARTGDAVQLAGYLGGSSRFERAIAAFADAYARTNERDHAALLDAIASGRVEAQFLG
jgi:uncharacterized protein (DUF2252 family)